MSYEPPEHSVRHSRHGCENGSRTHRDRPDPHLRRHPRRGGHLVLPWVVPVLLHRESSARHKDSSQFIVRSSQFSKSSSQFTNRDLQFVARPSAFRFRNCELRTTNCELGFSPDTRRPPPKRRPLLNQRAVSTWRPQLL